MTKEELVKFINEHEDSYPQIIKAKHKELYALVFNNYIGQKFSEKVYRFLNEGKEFGKCETCFKDTKFLTIKLGFSKFCCARCSNIKTGKQSSLNAIGRPKNEKFWDTIKCKLCNKEFQALKYRNQLFCSNDCSAKFTANDADRLNKIKSTKLEKYGNEYYVNLEKAKQTCMGKYGVDNVFRLPDIKNKIVSTNISKYGVEWAAQSEIVKRNIKSSNFKKYGVGCVFENKSIQEKIKITNLLKYGVKNVFQNKEIIENSKLSHKGIRYSKLISRLETKFSLKALFLDAEYDYCGRDKYYKFLCLKCNSEFLDYISGGRIPRCLVCNPYIAGFSYDEKEILNYIKSLIPDASIIEGDRAILSGKELDIYIPSKNIAIEYDGLFWHGELGGGKDKDYHLSKTLECEAKGIRLIHIFEDEWLNKQEIVKAKLKHILNKSNQQSIYARKCIIKEIEDCDEFLELNHIQGKCNSSVKLGAYYNEELVAVMTFSGLRLALGNKFNESNEYELLRFATNIPVIGIAGKFLSYFIKNKNPNRIITFADRRWSDGKLYNMIGFKKLYDTVPNYWYVEPGNILRYYRFGFRKDQLSKKLDKFDEVLTEWQNMQINGYDRIWDCGNIKYEWIKINI